MTIATRATCPVCGTKGALESKQGTLRSVIPAGKPLAGREILVEASYWEECEECGEKLIGAWLCKEMQKKYQAMMMEDLRVPA